MKFQRTYTMAIEQMSASVGADGEVVSNPSTYVKLPPELTVEFQISRVALSEAGHANFKLYNVPTSITESILKDYFNGQDVRGMVFNAGYVGQSLPRVFNGQLMNLNVSRASGATDNIIDMEVLDTGWDRDYAMCLKDGNPLPPFPAGTSVAEKVIALAALMPNVNPNIVIGQSFFLDKSTRPDTYSGLVWPVICELTGNKAFIDSGTLYVLGDYDVAPTSDVFVLDDTVILGSPRRSRTVLELKIIFEPSIKNGMCVTVNSDIAGEYNGNWKVYQVEHNGTISPAVDSGLVTTLTLWKGSGVSPSLAGAQSKGSFYPFVKV